MTPLSDAEFLAQVDAAGEEWTPTDADADRLLRLYRIAPEQAEADVMALLAKWDREHPSP